MISVVLIRLIRQSDLKLDFSLNFTVLHLYYLM